jgi:hypothetical protein
LTTGISDTGGKFATGVNDTGGKIATGINVSALCSCGGPRRRPLPLQRLAAAAAVRCDRPWPLPPAVPLPALVALQYEVYVSN